MRKPGASPPDTRRARLPTDLGWRVNRLLRHSLLGPQGLALLSAAMLAAYWYEGPGLMLVAGLVIPSALALAALAAAHGPGGPRDAVTGLPLRGSVEAELDRLLAGLPEQAQAATCFVVEIDDWSRLRRAHHAVAQDAILCRTADRLRAVLRDTDIVARLDGGAFALVPTAMRRADLDTALRMAVRLQGTVAEPLAIDGLRVHLTASVGFALPRQVPAATGMALLSAAEMALVSAMRQGPGTIRAFSRGVRSPRLAPTRLTSDVGVALEQGQIQPWFQPQVSTDTGEVTGFEALARWLHPEHGVIAPMEFLPAVAAAGQSDRMSTAILTQSLRALRDWDAAGYLVPTVSVNLNESDLADPAMPDRVRWELDRFDLEPGRLVVEILETVLAHGEEEMVVRNVLALRDMGVGIDLDDFGTGTASISAIRRFDVHRIKIDRSFIGRLDQDRAQQDMVAAILSMAERLGLRTLAEGVETPGEHAMVAQLGCDAVQGFGVAMPMPFDEATAWMEQNAERVDAGRWLGRRVM